MSTPNEHTIAYVGRSGTGLGFRLAGVAVYDSTSAEEAINTIKDLTKAETLGILFVDEELVAEELPAISKLNEQTLPAIVLLPTSTQSRNIAAQNLQNLMIKAIGSDIFNT
ncbi:MAG: V-type ATP synthase subunit F [Candidatus Andersenbacteria bacterium]|nr:V-type ATP synthase subunit F [Candidatus Andersenbacteria bacterium]